MRSQTLRIGLVLTHSFAHCRDVMLGVKEFAELRPNWVLLPVAPEPTAIRALAGMRPAGIIAHLFTEETARAVLDIQAHLVNVSGMMPHPVTPRVGNDDVASGRLAAQHLLDRGLRHFGFIGTRGQFYSTSRERGFRDVIAGSGHEVFCYHDRPPVPYDPVGRMWLQHRKIGRWLAKLPHPIGLLASDDACGFQLTEVCRQISMNVPEDVSIIGIENDELLCNLARPPLSSVQVPSRRIGMEAARLLDQLLRGLPPPRQPVLVPPPWVVSRRSTDVLAIDDADVALAARFIRDNAHRPLHICDILDHVAVSRRGLERRFRSVLGRSMQEEIRRVHIERACWLLTETEFPMPTIAESSGFSDAKQLWRVFRQCLGQTPREFRRSAADHSHHAITIDHSRLLPSDRLD